MKHIAINAHLLSPSANYRSAGIHRYIYHTLTHLPVVDEGKYRYTVFLNKGIALHIPRLHEQPSGFDTQKPTRRILWEQMVQPFSLKRLKPDLYHGMAFVAPWRVNCPSIVTVYDLSFERFPQILSRARRLYLQRFTRYSCHKATRIIAISESTARDLVDFIGIPREKIDIALPGVNPEFMPLPSEQVEQFRQEKQLPFQFFFFLGTLEPRKNLVTLIHAYAALPANIRQEVHLVLGGGKGWQYDDIFEAIATHRLENEVHTVGYIPTEEVVLWYNAAIALVYPPIFEGFGIPIIEAMACGKPVLASNTSSLPEAAGEVGLLLPPDDVQAWTQALLRAIEDQPWRNEASIQGQAWAKQFTWQRTAQQTLASYECVL